MLVSNATAPPAPGSAEDAGTVSYTSYFPTHLELRADARAPSLMLLNDHFAPGWQVSIDGRPAPMLRCNYIMRGVKIPAGQHLIEFKFVPPWGPFCVSLGAVLCGAILTAWFLFRSQSSSS